MFMKKGKKENQKKKKQKRKKEGYVMKQNRIDFFHTLETFKNPMLH